ncbi:hypothetical protein [Huintestinicola sp.]|uniref:hypothetical protein n=1 Tax=Huintestinicola sp. TaxID=2981661 RepID=UPI003D7D2E13
MEEIVLVRGDTLKLYIESIITSDGSEYVLSDTDVIYIDLKKEDDPETAVLHKEVTAADRSEEGLPIVLFPCETADIPFGNYVFDVRLVMDEDNIFTIIPATRLKIVRNITGIPRG